jgi:fumarate hydratase subunit alpha
MAIMGDDNQRIDQSGGLNPDSGALAPSPILIKPVDEDVLRLTILMLGGGPAIRGITQRVFHKHSVEVVIDEIVNRAIPAVSQLGCSPCTLAIGIGRSQFEATSLMMEAMVKGNFNEQTDFEKTITDRVNESNVGALGLGGKTSVLATFAKVGPQRASGVRIVALRPCCCFEPRRACVEI